MRLLQRKGIRALLGSLAVAGLMATLALGGPAAASTSQAALTGVEAAVAVAPDDNSIMCQGGSFVVPSQSIVVDTSGCSAPGNTMIRYGWNVHFAGAAACISVVSSSGWTNTGCHSPGTVSSIDVPTPSGSFFWPRMEGRNWSQFNSANIGWEWGV
jgi:hypothetical protein